MDKKHSPVGVFDSGVGGISVLKELVALMPHEDFIFYGDSANAPYGTRTYEEVQRLSMADAAYLMDKGTKALVVACNTATSAAIIKLREEYADMPVIGIEPALKPAVFAVSGNRRIVVMATPMTLREEKFMALMHAYEDAATIIPLPCPGLVEYVERGEISGSDIEAFLSELFAPYTSEGIDAVVLGCTHYSFVKDAVRNVLGERTLIFDGGAGTARETLRRLTESDLLNPQEAHGTVTLMNSDSSPALAALAGKLLNCEV